MIRLRLAIQNQLQLVEDNLSTGGDDFNSDPHKQDQSVYQQLLLSRSALSDALETVSAIPLVNSSDSHHIVFVANSWMRKSL